MRTTLKRTIGRPASANGNGQVLTALPSDVTTPVTRYRQPESAHGALRFVGRILFWLIAALVMVGSAFAGGVYLFFHESLAQTRPRTRSEKAAAAKLDVPLPHHPAIALVLGYDKRFGEAGPGRSDTLMLIRADPETKAISMLSFPRDLKVPIYCSSRYVQFTGKINSAYATCKEIGALNTVRALTGLSINYLITVNFRGFKQVVDKLGGVYMDVDHRYYHSNAGVSVGYRYAAINLQPGYQRLRGSDALEYVRYRHGDNDLYRNARQQLFVRAVKDQATSNFSITKLPSLVGAIVQNVHVSEGGHGVPSANTIVRYAKLAYTLPPGHVFQARIQGITGIYDLSAPTQSIQDAVNEFVNPDVEAADKAGAAAGVHRKPKRGVGPRPQQVTVMVLNGNGVPGAAANATDQLNQRGYATEQPLNGVGADAPRHDYYKTIIYYNARRPQAQAGAKKLANLFGAADVRRSFPRRIRPMAGGIMAVVVVGRTFHGSITPTPLDRTPAHEPAAVTRNPGPALGELRRLRRRVPFHLERPTLVEKASALDAPARVYPIAPGHKGVRLTFEKPAGCATAGIACEYWGIQETDWTDAPVLAGRSFAHVYKGRHFDFYFASSHLHMIVLREQNGASYWVVNTLLDSLSNETMIAIARGLRPVGK